MTVSLLLYKDERPWDSTMVRTGDDDPLHPRVLVGIAGTMIPQYPGMQQKMGVEQGRMRRPWDGSGVGTRPRARCPRGATVAAAPGSRPAMVGLKEISGGFPS